MIDNSQSYGTLNSFVTDSSTPSNNSQYFSVASSLDLLNGKDDLYYSVEDELDKKSSSSNLNYFRKYECHKIDTDIMYGEDGTVLNGQINSDEMTPEIFIHDCCVDVEDWDKVCDSLNSFISQESVSTDDDDEGDAEHNFSVVTNSFIDYSGIDVKNADSTEQVSFSENNSVIDGEFSEINDIVYDSFDSPDNEKSLKIEDESDKELTDVHDTCSLKTEGKNEFVEIEMVSETRTYSMPEPVADTALTTRYPCVEPEEDVQIANNHIVRGSLHTITDSPVRRSSLLCCSVKRKKTKLNSSVAINKSIKYKRLFSFFQFFKSKPLELVDKQIVFQPKISSCDRTICVAVAYDDASSDIPYMDDDALVSNDGGIPLAKQEIFSE